MTHTIANLTLHKQEPTDVDRDEMFNWVIWQFPTLRNNNLCGAVHPPISGYGWLPAIIHTQEKKIQVFAHLDAPFDSPETAVEYFNTKHE